MKPARDALAKVTSTRHQIIEVAWHGNNFGIARCSG